jgi:hypothetical protein
MIKNVVVRDANGEFVTNSLSVYECKEESGTYEIDGDDGCVYRDGAAGKVCRDFGEIAKEIQERAIERRREARLKANLVKEASEKALEREREAEREKNGIHAAPLPPPIIVPSVINAGSTMVYGELPSFPYDDPNGNDSLPPQTMTAPSDSPDDLLLSPSPSPSPQSPLPSDSPQLSPSPTVGVFSPDTSWSAESSIENKAKNGDLSSPFSLPISPSPSPPPSPSYLPDLDDPPPSPPKRWGNVLPPRPRRRRSLLGPLR